MAPLGIAAPQERERASPARSPTAGALQPVIAYSGTGIRGIGTIIQGSVLLWGVLEPEALANWIEAQLRR
jgi:hypothetical protein